MQFRKRIDKFLEWVLIALMVLLVVDVLWQVASRYLFATPSPFTDELAGFLLIWVGLLGSAYLTGQNEHLAIDFLIRKLSPELKNRLLIFINISIALFALSVLVVGGGWLVFTRFYLQVTSAALRIPLGYVYLVLPISGIIVIYYTLHNVMYTSTYRRNTEN